MPQRYKVLIQQRSNSVFSARAARTGRNQRSLVICCGKRQISYVPKRGATTPEPGRTIPFDTLDIFNTGECVSATGLVVSTDLNSWDWQGVILDPEATRVGTVTAAVSTASFPQLADNSLPFTTAAPGRRKITKNEPVIAVSSDLKSWRSLTLNGPALTVPHASRLLALH